MTDPTDPTEGEVDGQEVDNSNGGSNVVPIQQGRRRRRGRPTNAERDALNAERAEAQRQARQQRAEEATSEPWRRELVYIEDRHGNQFLAPNKFVNFRVLLTHHPDMIGRIRLNEFSLAIDGHDLPWERKGRVRALEDNDVSMAREWLQGQGLMPGKDETHAALVAAAKANAYHPVRDYLKGLEWDGVARLDMWLTTYLGANAGVWEKMIAPKMLIAAVARIMEPGCKVDTIPILEGPQGKKKSTAIKVLFSEQWFTDSASLFSKHAEGVMQMMGSWAVELGEFRAVRVADRDKTKVIISITHDKVRLPYARMIGAYARQCVFFATINPDEGGYLTDPTGNRRFWPFEVGKISIAKLTKDRDQLWAEAVRRYDAGEQWWIDSQEEADIASAQTAEREQDHPWQDEIAAKEAINQKTFITISQVADALSIKMENRNKSTEMTIAGCLKNLGWVKGKKYIDGVQVKGWGRSEVERDKALELAKAIEKTKGF